MNETKITDLEIFFSNFLREFKAGLRLEDKTYVDELIQDLLELSLIIPPEKGNYYTFREVLMLMALINQKKIQELLVDN